MKFVVLALLFVAAVAVNGKSSCSDVIFERRGVINAMVGPNNQNVPKEFNKCYRAVDYS